MALAAGLTLAASSTAVSPVLAGIEDDAQAAAENGAFTVRKAHYHADVCSIIAKVSKAHAVPAAFIARLIRTESRFDPSAVSPKGAQGIAQFMPGTARLRGLADPFNPAAALPAAIAYLAELRARFGNLGLAAAAYNAGERRVERLVAGDGGVPLETRNYVRMITGREIDSWVGKDDAEDDVTALDKELPFDQACVKYARTGRAIRLTSSAGPAHLPWGAQVAEGATRAVAAAVYRRLAQSFGKVIPESRRMIMAVRNPAMGRRLRHAALVGAPSRAEAQKTCAAIRQRGGYCLVRRTGR